LPFQEQFNEEVLISKSKMVSQDSRIQPFSVSKFSLDRGGKSIAEKIFRITFSFSYFQSWNFKFPSFPGRLEKS
jgi:hypothetical protein